MNIFQRLRRLLRRKPTPAAGPPPAGERGWSDREIAGADSDRFDFRDYAEVLAGRARNADTPLTIGLFGSWGSGKTSLMRLIAGELKGVETIWINVWQLSNQEEVWQAFLQALFNQVNRKLPLRRRVDWPRLGKSLLVNSYRILVVAIPVVLGAAIGNPQASWQDALSLLAFNLSASANQTAAAAGALTTYALAAWLLLKPGVEAARGIVHIDLKSMLKHGSYEVQISELMKLQRRFDGMVADLVGEGGRLVVFIDDLDRCAPDKIPDLLEAIKLFTTSPRCVYILGLDHAIVRQGIARKHRFKGVGEAEEYLEKIVQVPFHLPPLDAGKIAAFVHSDYPELNARCPTAPEVFSRGLEPNPRKVKRALNIYRTVLELADKRVSAWEMDPIDDELAAKMVVLQSRFPRLHQHLACGPETLIALEGEAGSGEISEETSSVLKELGVAEEADREALVSLLSAGESYFSAAEQVSQISSYIYLISTAQGAATGARPNRKEREALLGGDVEKIKSQVAAIRERGVEAAYIERLYATLRDTPRYTPGEVHSANKALDLLEGLERQDFEPGMVRVPAGSFLMGSTPEQAQLAIKDRLETEWVKSELPQHRVQLSAYSITRYPVTNQEYQAFLQDSGHPSPKGWSGVDFPAGKGDHPVVYVYWEDASVYCLWLSEKTGKPYRLPSEAEWEKAARGIDGRVYPWGDEFDPGKANTAESGPEGTTPVGQYSNKGGDSPYGCADMAGNVWEWCADWYAKGEYARRAGAIVKDPSGPPQGEVRLLRGGSFDGSQGLARCAFRSEGFPDFRSGNIGFRVGLSPIESLDSESRWEGGDIRQSLNPPGAPS